jgi:hypothetical protein
MRVCCKESCSSMRSVVAHWRQAMNSPPVEGRFGAMEGLSSVIGLKVIDQL